MCIFFFISNLFVDVLIVNILAIPRLFAAQVRNSVFANSAVNRDIKLVIALKNVLAVSVVSMWA